MMHLHRANNKVKRRKSKFPLLWCGLVAFSVLFMTFQFVFWQSHDLNAFGAPQPQTIPSTPSFLRSDVLKSNTNGAADYTDDLVNANGTTGTVPTWYRTYEESDSYTKKTPIPIRSKVNKTNDREYVSIFYNIYSAPSSENRTATIVDEQMQTVIESANKFFLQRNEKGEADSDRTLYFQTIGEQMRKNVVLQWCDKAPRFLCEHLGHSNKGDEVITLQALYEHCMQNKSERVIYMHDKGSFHASESNTYLRQFMTKAVTNVQCVRPDDDRCNVCSYQFSPLPFHHSPGNFWIAKCDYV